jgi:hypothetical protein
VYVGEDGQDHFQVIRGEGLALIAAVEDRELCQRRHPHGVRFVGAVAAHIPQTLLILFGLLVGR